MMFCEHSGGKRCLRARRELLLSGRRAMVPVSIEPTVILSGHGEGADALAYQERQVQRMIEESRK